MFCFSSKSTWPPEKIIQKLFQRFRQNNIVIFHGCPVKQTQNAMLTFDLKCPVLSLQFYPSPPFLATRPSCPGIAVLAARSWLSFPSCLFLAVCPVCPVLAVSSCMPCLGRPVLTAFPDCSFLAVLSWLSFLDVLFQHSCFGFLSGRPFLIVLSWLLGLRYNILG